MMNIKGASEAMADDMHDAAMKLGAAGMMLASVGNAVHKHAAHPTLHGRDRTGRNSAVPKVHEAPTADS